MKRSKIAVIIVSATFGVCGLCGFGLLTGFGNPEREYRAELAKGVAAGLPENPEDYQIQTPDSENAAPEYRAAITAWDRLKTTNPKLQTRLKDGTTSPTFSAAQAEKDLAQIQPIMAALDRAAKYPNCKFGKQYAKGYFEVFPELAAIKQFTRLRALRAGIYAGQGEFERAWQELYKGAVISQHLASDNPFLIQLLVQISNRAMLVREAERIFTRQGRNPKAAERAENLLRLMGPVPDMKRAIRGEYAFTIATLSLIDDPRQRELVVAYGSSDNPEINVPQKVLDIPSLRFQNQAKVLMQLREAYEGLPADSRHTHEVMSATTQFDAKLSAKPGIFDLLSAVMLPPLGLAGNAVVRSQVQEDLLRILAMSLSQPRGIKIPTNLGPDPFSAKPYRISQKGSSLRIWSVGPDLIDNGGDPIRSENRKDANGEPQYDVVVGYPYVPKTVAEQKAYGAAWLGTLRKP
jgi:hypothetical protein